MDQTLHAAKERLRQGHHTCVLMKGDTVYPSDKRGVQPLREWLLSKQDLHGFVAADRVVGKAAAFLYVLLGVDAVWAEIVSKPAEAVLRRYGISLEYDTRVDAIRNRAGDGFCPMEQAVWEIDDPEQAQIAIEQTYQALTKKEAP